MIRPDAIKDQVLTDAVARRFLLGQLPAEEQGRVEELAFEDRDAFEFLESVENDLIDEFIHGDLSADEVKCFEDHFLYRPGARNNLNLTRLWQEELQRAIPASDKKKFSLIVWFRLQSASVQISMAVAVGLALIVIAVLLFARPWESKQPTPFYAGPESPGTLPSPQPGVSPSYSPAPPSHSENKPKGLTPQKQRRSPFYALLSPSSAPRSADTQPLPLARGATIMTVELALVTERKLGTMEAVLENEAGTTLQRWPNLQAEELTSGKGIKIRVPVALLKPGDFYRIIVTDVSSTPNEIIARYPFEVVEESDPR